MGYIIRLCTQGTPILPKILTPELIRNLTPIDGAIILNPKGTCYAIGAILDGMATETGDPGRGARYNSAIRYVGTSKYPCIAIVISEDGGVDFIPDLKPAIQRSHIEKAIAKLHQVLADERIDYRKYNETMEWLSEHSFYLLPKDCTDANKLKTLIENRIQSEDPQAIRIIRSEFTPNPAMCPNLYYEVESPSGSKE